jgi:hypothetical protein
VPSMPLPITALSSDSRIALASMRPLTRRDAGHGTKRVNPPFATGSEFENLRLFDMTETPSQRASYCEVRSAGGSHSVPAQDVLQPTGQTTKPRAGSWVVHLVTKDPSTRSGARQGVCNVSCRTHCFS